MSAILRRSGKELLPGYRSRHLVKAGSLFPPCWGGRGPSEKARSRAGAVAHLWREERGEKWRKRREKAASASGAGQRQHLVTLGDPAHEQAGSLSTSHLTLNKLH